MKKHLILVGFIALVFSVALVLAVKPDFAPQHRQGIIAIPSHAVEVAPGVFSLGKAIDHGRVVEGYAFIDYKKGFGKQTGCNNDGVCQGWEDASCADCTGGGEEPTPDTSSCYGFLAKGTKWRTIEPYIVNPVNTRGLDGIFVTSNFASDVGKWETAAGVEILGDETTGIVDGADLESPDNKNEVYFADVGYENAIAITIVWGIFGGPPPFRELVEWDMIFDDVDFDWGIGEAGKMDFENIATHELGHSVGLGDLYTSECSEQTMYGYASYGETKKRTLEAGDIAGVQELYS
ncbi:hypothetical protein CEE44_01180 [Candidatus Woesearchaeota archaeon B3_Woes]|nr:MAG: hypothetical protein CEE44_01180 [Candidatus Woesearchaeota archaeon B3_Woes]